MSNHVRARLALSVAAPALAMASLLAGGPPDSTATDVQGPFTCHEGFCRDSTGSGDAFWPWRMLLPTGSAGSS